MKNRVLIFGVLMTVAFGAASDSLLACGDKFLNLGLGTRYQRSAAERKAAAVLLYANTGTDLSRVVATLSVDAALKKGGYQPTIVSSAEDLDAALSSRQWQVIVIDGQDTQALSQRVRKPGGPHLVPVLTRPTKDDLKQARKIYLTVLDTPSKSRVFVDVVDDALDFHEMEVKAAAKAAKKALR